MRAAFEIETVAFLEPMMFPTFQFDFEAALQDEDEFLSFVHSFLHDALPIYRKSVV